MAALLTVLTSTKRRLFWDSAAEATFVSLKERFTSTPILVLPDPTRQFVVEVDTSDLGVGAILSQRAQDNKLIPSCFVMQGSAEPKRQWPRGFSGQSWDKTAETLWSRLALRMLSCIPCPCPGVPGLTSPWTS